jgi:hypothetical protein
MEKIFIINFIIHSLHWLSGKTKWKWDDKIMHTLKNLLSGSPELVEDAQVIYNYGKKGLKDLKREYKQSKSKTATTKLLGNIIMNSPKKEVEKVISSVKTELKKK